jgi:hypothetical protein
MIFAFVGWPDRKYQEQAVYAFGLAITRTNLLFYRQAYENGQQYSLCSQKN